MGLESRLKFGCDSVLQCLESRRSSNTLFKVPDWSIAGVQLSVFGLNNTMHKKPDLRVLFDVWALPIFFPGEP